MTSIAGAARIDILDQPLLLLPGRAMYWAARRTLFMADAHLGTESCLRGTGVPLPCGASLEDLSRLSGLISATRAERLVALGDLTHGPGALDEQVLAGLARFRSCHQSLHWVVVRGNHDHPTLGLYPCPGLIEPGALGIEWLEPGHVLGPFILRHEPHEPNGPNWSSEGKGGYTLAGHVHAGVRLSGAGRQRERLRAFIMGSGQGILPAFGSLTGCLPVRIKSGDRVFVLAEGQVIEAR